MFTQLNPPIPLETPHGEGLAYAVIDYGPDFDLLWVVFDGDSGECWTWPNPQVRAVRNVTLGRRSGKGGPSAIHRNTNGHDKSASGHRHSETADR